MPQSLQALLALFIFSIFIVTQHQYTSQEQARMVNQAISVLANGVATERLDFVASMGFDQATVDNNSIDSKTDLTLHNAFGPSQDRAGDDLDDFSGTTITVQRGEGGSGLFFQAETHVTYVSESDLESAVPTHERTRYKKIEVVVYPTQSIGVPDTVRVSRVESCKSSCQW